MLAQHAASKDRWEQIEAHLHARAMTLREVLSAHASLITITLDEADAFLETQTRIDPAFKEFAARCQARAVPVTILSSGIAPLIERALARNGIAGLPVHANGVDPRPEGWVMRFRDPSDNGHDKAAEVRAARARGSTVVYIGDGYSDYDAAVAADLRFAKCGRALVAHLRERNLPFVEFTSFAEVTAHLRI
ncbi:MAG: haloacid dehalogenase-like hydrolase [Candidatus Eremiobacteraeota bacterium]|nr:haloacid dehalogenase-like hydrolase [Candidatus Eremiobacteraeota bacterium]